MANTIVSIITVNFNAGDALAQCVNSVLANVTVPCEVIVVDNGSTDDSLAFLRHKRYADSKVRLVKSRENLGFAVANNIGAAYAVGKYLHFLNPDTVVTPSLDLAYQALSNNAADAIWVTAIADRNGDRVKSDHLLPIIANYWQALFCPRQARRWYLGASVIMSREVFERLGGWPIDYFMYAEDLDLFYRAAMLDISVIKCNATVVHTSEGTTSRVWDERSRWLRKDAAYWKFSQKYGRVPDYFLTHTLSALRDMVRDPQAVKYRAYAVFNHRRVASQVDI